MTQQIIKSGFIEHFKGLNNPNKSFNTIIFTSSGNLKRGYESDFVNILNLNPVNKLLLIVSNKKDKKGLIKIGNERVVDARLSDAEFFWNRDKTKNLVKKISLSHRNITL